MMKFGQPPNISMTTGLNDKSNIKVKICYYFQGYASKDIEKGPV